MSSQSENNRGNADYQDEISISELLNKLWWRRGLLVVLPAMFLLLAVIYLFFNAVQASPPTVHYVQLQGIEKSEYPNGTRFTPQDLLIPEVLERAAERLNLEVDSDLRSAIDVEYGVPTTAGIRKKYQQKLSGKNLSSTEIEDINDEYTEELESISQRGLRISVNHIQLGIEAEQGAELAMALPDAWSEVFTQKYRVLLAPSLDGVAIVGRENPLKSTSDIISARNTLRRIEQGLDVLSSDNRLQAVISRSGLNAADLKSELQGFNELYFRPLLVNLFSDPDQVAASFIAETQLKIDEISRNIEEIDRSIADIRSFRMQASNEGASDGTGETVQFGDNTIRQIIDMANQASLSDYLRESLSARRELAEERSALLTEISRSQEMLEIDSGEEFLRRAQQEYAKLTDEYISLLSSSRKISRQNYGDFYRPLGAPVVAGGIMSPKAALTLVLALLLGGFIAAALALVLPVREQK